VRGWRSQNLENKPYLAISRDGKVFITDPEGYRVIQFDSNGEFVQLWGTFGTGPENFGLASGIAIDRDGHVWVTDAGNGRVMRFTLP
jgi:sugar lactone lactonase YvrE